MKQEKVKLDEVSVTITNSEFVEDTLEILRGDMFFKIFDKANKDFEKHKMNYHLEFQTKNWKKDVSFDSTATIQFEKEITFS